jgi:methyl-accepting chemotaxis protein
MSNENQPNEIQDTLGVVLEECARGILPLLPRLSSVIKDREEDFLRLGTTVFDINSRAGAFSRAATGMASSVGEGALHDAISELETEAAEARSVFGKVSPTEQMDGMAEVLQLIRTLGQAMSRFETLVRTLKVLEITTRIESARIGASGAGFTTLADDVRSLGSVIDEHTTKIAEHSVRLMNQVSGAQERSRRQLSSQEQLVKGMFEQLFSSIAELETMRANSTALVTELAEGSRRVARNMGHVIASVQFHDITRQQVEHVEEILVQAEEEIRGRTGETDLRGLGAWTRDVLRLQAPLLRQSQESFHQAVADLIGNLDSIAESTRALGDRITSVAYADQGGPSTLDAISGQIARVTEAMRASSDHVVETSRTMTGMAETISTVSSFVRGIEDIGTEIEIIALNARVKAAHTGDQGRTLGVIAMEIQNLSAEARNRTGEVASILNRISRLAERLSDLARSSDVSELVGGIQNRFDAILGKLSALDHELEQDIGSLSVLAKEIGSHIHDLTDSIDFHERVSEQLLELEQTIIGLEKPFEALEEVLDAARQPEKLKEQLSRYTMDSERLIHLSILGHDGADEHAAPTDGDDVELFGDDDVELFGDDSVELFEDDGVELFGDDSVELFDDPRPEAGKDDGKTEPEDDLGDNVELF